MATEPEPAIEPPECSNCDIVMEFMASGTQESAPVVGTEIEYQRFACPECGQGARFERDSPDAEWTRAGT